MKRYSKDAVSKISEIIRKNSTKTNYEIAQLINAAGFTRPKDGAKFNHFDVANFYNRYYKIIGRDALIAGRKTVIRRKRRAKKVTTTTTTTTAVGTTTAATYDDDSQTLLHLVLDAKLPDAKKLALIKALWTQGVSA